MSEHEPVRLERQGAVAVITIDRPERRNALDVAAKVALRDAVLAVAEDAEVRAVVLTGAGGAFCAGQDLAEHAAELEGGDRPALSTVVEHYNPTVTALATMPKPVVAAVPGTCAGAGLGLALACDLLVMAQGAKLGTAFTAIGLTCDSGLSWSLPRAVGDTRARELLLTAELFTAEQAVDWGLAARLLPADEVLPAALELAGRLAQGPTAAYAATKRLLVDAAAGGLGTALQSEADEQAALGSTEDHRGAVSAFLAKERPRFQGR